MVAMLKIYFHLQMNFLMILCNSCASTLIFNTVYAWYAINFDADQNKFSDNEQAKSSRDLIAGFIDELILNYSIDAKAVSLASAKVLS
jgi:hypothetical protein